MGKGVSQQAPVEMRLEGQRLVLERVSLQDLPDWQRQRRLRPICGLCWPDREIWPPLVLYQQVEDARTVVEVASDGIRPRLVLDAFDGQPCDATGSSLVGDDQAGSVPTGIPARVGEPGPDPFEGQGKGRVGGGENRHGVGTPGAVSGELKAPEGEKPSTPALFDW